MKIHAWFAAVSLCFIPISADALHFHADPPMLHLQGQVEPADWRRWQEAMDQFGDKITTVVFHNSPGGHSSTGRNIGKSIRQRGLTTVVAGRCMSACANMFLGGKQRIFSSRMHAQPTVLGYHGTYRGVAVQQWTSEAGDYFKEMSDGKLTEELIDKFTSLERPSGALYFIHISQRNNDSQALAYYCHGTENSRKRDEACERPDFDALKVGIVTSWDVAVTPAAPPFQPGRPGSKNW